MDGRPTPAHHRDRSATATKLVRRERETFEDGRSVPVGAINFRRRRRHVVTSRFIPGLRCRPSNRPFPSSVQGYRLSSRRRYVGQHGFTPQRSSSRPSNVRWPRGLVPPSHRERHENYERERERERDGRSSSPAQPDDDGVHGLVRPLDVVPAQWQKLMRNEGVGVGEGGK